MGATSQKLIDPADSLLGEGVDVVVDQYPYDRSSTNLGITLPSWALADGQAKIKERLADASTRGRIAKEIQANLKKLGHKDYSYAVVAACSSDRSTEGKSISEINRMRRGKKKVAGEIQTILDLEAAGGAQMVYHSMGEKDVDRISGATPGWDRQRRRYPRVRGRRSPSALVRHERARAGRVRAPAKYSDPRRRRPQMTPSFPARTFGFRDRGQIRGRLLGGLGSFRPCAGAG